MLYLPKVYVSFIQSINCNVLKVYGSFIQNINCNVLYLPKVYGSFIQNINCKVLYLPKVYASFIQSINCFIKEHLFDDTYIVLKVISPPPNQRKRQA